MPPLYPILRPIHSTNQHIAHKKSPHKPGSAARYGYDQEKKEDRVEFVPCVLFNPSEKLQSLLAEEGKGMRIELQGRVATSKFEADGETRFSTEVVVDKRSLKIVSAKDSLPY